MINIAKATGNLYYGMVDLGGKSVNISCRAKNGIYLPICFLLSGERIALAKSLVITLLCGAIGLEACVIAYSAYGSRWTQNSVLSVCMMGVLIALAVCGIHAILGYQKKVTALLEKYNEDTLASNSNALIKHSKFIKLLTINKSRFAILDILRGYLLSDEVDERFRWFLGYYNAWTDLYGGAVLDLDAHLMSSLLSLVRAKSNRFMTALGDGCDSNYAWNTYSAAIQRLNECKGSRVGRICINILVSMCSVVLFGIGLYVVYDSDWKFYDFPAVSGVRIIAMSIFFPVIMRIMWVSFGCLFSKTRPESKKIRTNDYDVGMTPVNVAGVRNVLIMETHSGRLMMSLLAGSICCASYAFLVLLVLVRVEKLKHLNSTGSLYDIPLLGNLVLCIGAALLGFGAQLVVFFNIKGQKTKVSLYDNQVRGEIVVNESISFIPVLASAHDRPLVLDKKEAISRGRAWVMKGIACGVLLTLISIPVAFCAYGSLDSLLMQHSIDISGGVLPHFILMNEFNSSFCFVLAGLVAVSLVIFGVMGVGRHVVDSIVSFVRPKITGNTLHDLLDEYECCVTEVVTQSLI